MLDHKANLLFLLPLRLLCGWMMATAGFGKVESGWLTHPHILARIEEWLRAGRTYKPLLPLLGKALQHGQALSITVAAVELCAGAALLFGLFSRLSALLGFLLYASFLLAAGDVLSANQGLLFAIALLTLALCGSGRVLGLDAALTGRVPAWLS